MFVAIGLLISIFAFGEITSSIIVPNNKFFYVFALILMGMLCLRYGQGTDYHEYEIQYLNINSESNIWVNSLYHGELGWFVLVMIFKRLGFSFFEMIGVLSFVMMYSTIRAIKRYSPYRILSLILLYPTFYLTYYYSAIRQGLVLSIFLGFGIQWLIEKKYFKYFVLVALLSMIHTSAIVLLIIPFALIIKDDKISKYIIVALLCMAIAGYTGFLNSIVSRFGFYKGYFTVSISYLAILLRIIFFYIVDKMYKATRDDTNDEKQVEDVLYYIYAVGFVMYLMFAFSGTLSQRMTMPMKGVEIILIPMLAFKSFQCQENCLFSIPLLMLIVILALDVEFIKNINSYIEQGNYYDWINVFNYPYVSVFNKEDIFYYISDFD